MVFLQGGLVISYAGACLSLLLKSHQRCSALWSCALLQALPKLAAQGISPAVVSMDTPFAMAAWAKSLGVDDDMLFLSDPRGMLGKALGATFDAGPLGLRGRRYAMLLDNLKIRAWQLEETGELTCSTADNFLESIDGL